MRRNGWTNPTDPAGRSICLDPKRFDARVSALDARLEALREPDHPRPEIATADPTTADPAQLPAVAGHLDETIANGGPEE